MADIRLPPIAGINNVQEDAALMRGGDNPRLYVRDARDVDVTSSGEIELRPAPALATATRFRNLWESPLHGDVFATLGAEWVRVNPDNWTYDVLATVGEGDISHCVLNNLVAVSGPAGIFTFDGAAARRLTIPTPAPPMVQAEPGAGSLVAGSYGVAVAWMRGGAESATSEATFIEVGAGAALSVVLPMVLEPEITAVRLYLTRPNGGELLLAGEYPAGTAAVALPTLPELGRPAPFRYLSPMPTGRWLRYWRGRLLTARANVLRWSEAMAYHLHDERAGFILMPQRITFVEPVDGGIWVGQADHVAFLSGTAPGELALHRRASRPPVPGSAVAVPADLLGGDLAPGGGQAVVWLAGNGYVVGTPDGAAVELQASALRGIAASRGTSVVLERRLLTAVT